ncbi:DUF2332 domain-containing protein [Nocardiopsis prasina]|uniref:DUF2332 domain-containing protein n=1 Tax=Nocardiopsis prasina TaxID=2015 RepID=UPI0003466E99|nr:DUF2332 domain-containing protein [Nocardiopsis prasina]
MSADTAAERERARVADRYRWLATSYARGGSPDYERIALGVAGDARTQDLVLTLPEGNKRQPNLLLGAVRYLGGPTGTWEGFRDWVAEHWDRVRGVVMARMTQTNEVRRCATLLPVLARLEGPLALVEVGASAGLCLYPDRYRYSYDGGVPLGPRESPVLLECRTSGGVPLPGRVPDVVWRAGLDLNPLDAGDEGDVRWLESLVWPGEHRRERVERLRAAASVVAADPPVMVAGDLVEALPELAARAPEGATLVVLHSAVAAYLSEGGRADLERLMGGLPGHWVSNEGWRVFPEWEGARPPVGNDFTLAVDGRVVAYTGEHGQSLAWR